MRGGIDLPGTFIGISSTKTNLFSCFERENSLGNWKKVHGIVCAYVTFNTQNNAAHDVTTSTEIPCKDALECKIQKLCKDFMDESAMNGMQLSISKGNKTKYSFSLGYADVENNIRVTDSTRFRMNSVSKAMTSVALIKLMAERKLDLDESVQRYVPDFLKKISNKYSTACRSFSWISWLQWEWFKRLYSYRAFW